MPHFSAQNRRNAYPQPICYYPQNQYTTYYIHNQPSTYDPITARAAEVATANAVKAAEKTRSRAQYQVPGNAPAIFSTNDGTIPKRPLQEPHPPPVLRTDERVAVLEKADQLRKAFPHLMSKVKKVTSKTDIYDYFDGFDLWTHGIAFLSKVINEMNKKNEENKNAIADVIDQEAILWVHSHERQILVSHARNRNDLNSFFREVEEAGMFDDCLPAERDLLQQALLFYRNLLLQRVQESNQLVAQQELQNRSVRQTISHQAAHDSAAAPVFQGRSILHLIQPAQDVASLQPSMQRTHGFHSANAEVVEPSCQLDTQGIESHNSAAANTRPQAPNNRTASCSPAFDCGIQGPNRPVEWTQTIRRRMSGPGRAESRHNNYWPQNTKMNFEKNGTQVEPNISHLTPSAKSATSEPIHVLKSQDVRLQPIPDRSAEGVNAMRRRQFNTNPAREDPLTGKTTSLNTVKEPVSSGTPTHPSDSICCIFKDDPKAKVHLEKQSVTYFYVEIPRKHRSRYGPNRAVYVAGIEKGFFATHGLREMMMNCGDVETIHYMEAKNHRSPGTAFVTFLDESSPARAIERFDGHILATGHVICVDLPRDMSEQAGDRTNYLRNSTYGWNHSQYSNPVSFKQQLAQRPVLHGQQSFYPQSQGSLKTYLSSKEPFERSESSNARSRSKRNPVTREPLHARGNATTAFETVPGQLIIEATVTRVLQHRSVLDRFNQHTTGCFVETGLIKTKTSSNVEASGLEKRPNSQIHPKPSGAKSDVRGDKNQSFQGVKVNSPLQPLTKISVSLSTAGEILPKRSQGGSVKSKTAHCGKKKSKPNKPSPEMSTALPSHDVNSTLRNVDGAVIANVCESAGSEPKPSNAKKEVEDSGGMVDSTPNTGSAKTIETLPNCSTSDVDVLEPFSGRKNVQSETKSKKRNAKGKNSGNLAATGEVVNNSKSAVLLTEKQQPLRATKFNESCSQASKREATLGQITFTNSFASTEAGSSTSKANAGSEPTELTESFTSMRSSSSSGNSSDMSRKPSQGSETTNTTVSPAEPSSRQCSRAGLMENDAITPGLHLGASPDLEIISGAIDKMQNLVQWVPGLNKSSSESLLPAKAEIREKSTATPASHETLAALVKPKPNRSSGTKGSSSKETTREKRANSLESLDDYFEFPTLKSATSPPSSIADGESPSALDIPRLYARHASTGKQVVIPALPLMKSKKSSFEDHSFGSQSWPFIKYCKKR